MWYLGGRSAHGMYRTNHGMGYVSIGFHQGDHGRVIGLSRSGSDDNAEVLGVYIAVGIDCCQPGSATWSMGRMT
jgi:hypothetical protein